jgi:hypothetical protein
MVQKNKNQIGIQKQGLLHEEFAQKLIGGDAENLNNNPKLEDMGLHAGNYPNFDIFSSNEICSVKSHFTQDGAPNIQSYKNDFSKMLGSGKPYQDGLSPLALDAKRISECAAKGIPVPEEIKEASQEQVVQFLKEKSVMRIPSDHVESVREALVNDARQLPEKYFLPENPTEEQLRALSERIQSTGLNSNETFEHMNAEEQHPSKIERSSGAPNEDVSKSSQVNTETIRKNSLNNVHEKPSEDEDYHYGYGY